MKFQFTLFVAAIAMISLGLTACGSAAPTPRPTATTAPPTLAPTQPPPTATATQPPTATSTPTQVPVQSTAKQDVNTRKGPGLEYPIAQKMTKDTKANVVGKNTDGKWLQLAFPDAANPSWVSATFLTITGALDTIPVVQVAALPTATRNAAGPTKAAAATETVTVPAPHGSIGLVFYEDASNSYFVGSVGIDAPSVSGFKQIGPKPGTFDINPDYRTNSAPFAWSPDGSWLAYITTGGGNVDVLKTVKASNPDNVRTIESHTCISSPRWQDNLKILFIAMDDQKCTTQAILRARADGIPLDSSERQLYKAVGGESLRGLSWGTFVLFVSNRTGAQEIWRMNQDGSGATAVTNDKRENGSPAWSPDGSKFAYYSKQADGSTRIIVANADGSSPRVLPGQAGNNYSPTWSPDGNWIAFASDRVAGRLDIYIMNKNGGQVQQLTGKSTFSFMQAPESWR